MQRKQRFVADQRYDLPHHESMLGLIDAEFYAYNRNFFSPNNLIIKGWKIINNGGLEVKIDQGEDSLLMNSERVDHETLVLRRTTDDELLLTLADNAINYVEVQIISGTCAPDTVAIWDTTANGNAGEEFTQTVDTQAEERPVLVFNTIGFTGDPDKLPLAIVTTSGGVISSIDVNAREFYYRLASDWDFGITRTDRTIGNNKENDDALKTAIKEMKGTSNWFDIPFASNKLLKEYQNMFFYGGGTVGWEGVFGVSNLGWSNAINIEIADRPWIYTINPATVSVPEGSAVYVDIPEGMPIGALTPVVTPMANVPIDPSSGGYSPRIQVLFFRRNNTIYGMMDIPDLESGESGSIGFELSNTQLTRLGMVGDAAYVAYTSAYNIAPADSYAIAISKLDAALYAIQTDTAEEERFTVGIGGQTVFTTSILEDWDISNAVPDIQVFVNGVKVLQALDGNPLNGDYIKTAVDQITFSYTVPENAVVCIRDERTGGGGGGGGSIDLLNIIVDPQPDVNGNHSLGSVSKGWKGLYLKDTVSAQVYKLEVTSGVLSLTPVP